MNTLKKNSFVLLFFILCLGAKSQSIAVYKIDDLIKRIKTNTDTVYVVNFWATWCKPCVEELPVFEKLNATKDSINPKIKVLLVTLDFKDQLKKRVKPFVKKKNYRSEVVLLDEVNGNDFIDRIDKKWTGAIPATLVLKKTAQVFYEGKIDAEKLMNLINQIK